MDGLLTCFIPILVCLFLPTLFAAHSGVGELIFICASFQNKCWHCHLGSLITSHRFTTHFFAFLRLPLSSLLDLICAPFLFFPSSLRSVFSWLLHWLRAVCSTPSPPPSSTPPPPSIFHLRYRFSQLARCSIENLLSSRTRDADLTPFPGCLLLCAISWISFPLPFIFSSSNVSFRNFTTPAPAAVVKGRLCISSWSESESVSYGSSRCLFLPFRAFPFSSVALPQPNICYVSFLEDIGGFFSFFLLF